MTVALRQDPGLKIYGGVTDVSALMKFQNGKAKEPCIAGIQYIASGLFQSI